MRGRHSPSITESIEILFRDGRIGDLTDSQLLERFLSQNGYAAEAAFAALVERHGTMVMQVCRQQLFDPHAAEDASQATFLILALRARSIRRRGSLASWLFGVARRVAAKARADAARRQRAERRVIRTATEDSRQDDPREAWTELQEEIAKLPEKWRAAIVSCYLEGRSQPEAARQLGCPLRTLENRLARGRDRLRQRLTRRGLAPGSAGLTALLSDGNALAVPAWFCRATVDAAMVAARGEKAVLAGKVSAQVVALTTGVLKAMSLTKLKWTMALTLVVGIAAAVTAAANFQSATSDEPKFPSAQGKSQAVSKPAVEQTQPNQGSDDAKSLQGEWQFVDGERGGRPLPADPSGLSIIFKGEEISLTGGIEKLKYRLNTGKSPRELDIISVGGPQKGLTIPAIYSLEKDELKLCLPFEPSGAKIARPTEFKTTAGSNLALWVLRRAPRDGAAVKKLVERPDELANIQRPWQRPDAPPDGNYKLLWVKFEAEWTQFIIKLETRDGKQTASVVDVSEARVNGVRLGVRLEVSPMPRSQGARVRLVLMTPDGDRVFEGVFPRGSLEAKGNLEIRPGEVLAATLRATDLTKLKFTIRELPPGPLHTALESARRARNFRMNAERTTDAKSKAELSGQAASAERKVLAEVPGLLREGVEKGREDPLVFEAVLEAAKFATKYRLRADQLRAMIAQADKTAASYGYDWQREFDLEVATALAPQKNYAALALEMATRLDKELRPTDHAALRQRVLKALATARESAASDLENETLGRRLADAELILDREYRAKVPSFKPALFTGRKARSDRAVVLELFTGTECPPCVAASVAFDALPQTYLPAELVLIQYHLHIPGPDPLANTDSEARAAYYAKLFPGVPTAFVNGKSAGHPGGDMKQSEAVYKQYRQAIDPLLESASAAKLSASAVKEGDKVRVNVAVNDLQKPGRDIRLRLLIVEETVRYVGGNGVRFHHHVVRGMIGGEDGFPLSDKDSKHTAVVELDVLRKSLKTYLDDYNNTWSFPKADRPLDLSNLRLIALVQDDATREIIQAAEAETVAQGDTGKKK